MQPYSYKQLQDCKTEEQFKRIWDPDKFKWEKKSDFLAERCYKFFNIWWDPDRFYWKRSQYLAICCSEYFKIWWDEDKYNWKKSEYLPSFCKEYSYLWSPRYVLEKLKRNINQ